MPTPPAAGRDDDALSGGDLRPVAEIPGGQEDHGEGGRLDHVGSDRNRKHVRDRDDDLLGMAPEERNADDRLSRRKPFHTLPRRLDDAGDLHPRNEGRHRSPRVCSGADEEVREVQPDRGRANENLAPPRGRIGPRAQDEPIGSSETVHEPRARFGRHRSRAYVAISSGAMSPPLRRALEVLPGLALSVAVMIAAGEVARRLGGVVLSLEGLEPAGRSSPISGISMAIVLGLLIANTVGTAKIFRAGLVFAVRRMLRLGIILVGVRLSFFDVVKLGAWGIPVVATIVAVALVTATALARALASRRISARSPRPRRRSAASRRRCRSAPSSRRATRRPRTPSPTSLSSASSPCSRIPTSPTPCSRTNPGRPGLFLGTGIHDTSQVMGAALSYKDIFRDDAAFRVATVTKLTRNVFLVAVVPLLAYLHARRTGHEGRRIRLARLFPMFVLGFLAMAIGRSIGDASLAAGHLAYGMWNAPGWLDATKTVGETWGSACLGTAMGGVGLSTNLKTFGAMGWRPLYVGGLAAILVALLALALAALVGPHLSLAT